MLARKIAAELETMPCASGICSVLYSVQLHAQWLCLVRVALASEG